MKIDHLTPNDTILKELGERLARIRKAQGHTQEALADSAGLGVATLRRIEDGRDSHLGSWLKLLKALHMEGAIETLLPQTFQSPMAEARRAKKKRPSSGPGFAWGDEQ